MLGPLMIDIEGCTLSPADRELLRHPQVGGVILFARNYEEPAQLRALTEAIHALREPRLLIAVDQEGGRVQRFRHDFVELPALAMLGELYDRDPDAALALAADCAWMMASELRAVGVDFSFAPVLDLRMAHSAVIGDRALHGEPHTVARLAQAYVGSLHASGMVAVGKHFPGHGCVAADSHHELPVDERDLYDIEQADLLPFRALVRAGLEGIMMAHVLYPRVDSVAAGYSRRWIGEVLRGDLRFEGVVFSDDLSMAGAALGAASSYAERAELALAAGCDVLLVCNRRDAVVEILDALGRDARFPSTQARLTRMHGRGAAPDLASLHASSRWSDVAARLGDLNRCPELELGDDNLLA
ncbi:MAG: beta-N-acetylhexosaminidase [Gammaproteobacteria bacterium]|nr:beta-N-acetylhexosaminidase [Gammaproteobacteria bacterium]